MAEGETDKRSLGAKAASGVAWTVAFTLLARIGSMVVNILVTRYVSPADYGEVQGATVLAGTAAAVTSFGLGAYLVANPKEGREVTWHATFIGLMTCALALGIMLLFQEPLGHAFKLTSLQTYLPWFAVAALIERACMPMEKLLVRQLHYRAYGIIAGMAEATYAISTFAIVVSGYGALGIVLANVARALVKFVAYSRLVERRDWLEVGPIRWSVIKPMFKFGLPLSLAGVADYVSHRWDNMMTSRFFGPSLMGPYNIAYSLAEVPNEIIGERAGDALLPAFAQLEEERRYQGLVRAIKLLALILFPLSFGLAAVAETAVRAVFDPRWAPVAPMLSVLCGVSLARPLTYATAMYLQSLSQTWLLPIFEVTKTALMLGLMAALGPLGPLWACGAVVASFTLHAIVMLAVVGRRGEGIWSLLIAPLPALVACVPMVGAVLGVRWLFPQTGLTSAWIQLICEIFVGGVVGIGSMFLFAPAVTSDLLGLVKRLLRRGK